MIFMAHKERDGDATRRRLLAIIRDRPGIHKAGLCEESGLAWGTVHYHLRVLERARTVVIDAGRREARIFPDGTPERHRAWLGALRNPDSPRILGELQDAPGQGVTDLSRRLGLSPKVVRRHLDRMHRRGLVERTDDRRPEYRPHPDADFAEVQAPRMFG